MDKNVSSDVGVTAEQARKMVESSAPVVNKELYARACREIRSSAKCGKRSCIFPVDYGWDRQDALAKKLTEDGFKVTWIYTGGGPRSDDNAVMKITW